MIVPSIDIMDGQAVQLVGGERKALEAGDPIAIARRWRVAGELAVIDLDAALGRGSNAELIREIVRVAPCRVGGGIRDAETALDWLDAGAERVILGTAATPEVLSPLPRDRVVVALDARDGEVVVDGWRRGTGASIADRLEAIRNLAGGLLVTIVEREGRMEGTDLDAVRAVVAQAGDLPVTVAGGVTTVEEVAAIDALGADVQLGMALYTGRLDLADAFAAPLIVKAGDEPWPTVVTDEHGVALGLAWSSRDSLRQAMREGRGVYESRRRGRWVKGETSGDTQTLLGVTLDCDRDALRFTVKQHGRGFCHNGTHTCWGDDRGLGRLARRLAARRGDAPAGSYTRRLMEDDVLLASKLREEVDELMEATTREEIAWETADVIYFALVAMARAGVELSEVTDELERRARRVRRRSALETGTKNEVPSC